MNEEYSCNACKHDPYMEPVGECLTCSRLGVFGSLGKPNNWEPKAKKSYGESATKYRGFPIFSILVSDQVWFKLLPTDIIIKMDKGKIIMDQVSFKDGKWVKK